MDLRQKKTLDLDKISKKMDKWTFIISLSFMILFNIIYWIMAERSQNHNLVEQNGKVDENQLNFNGQVIPDQF